MSPSQPPVPVHDHPRRGGAAARVPRPGERAVGRPLRRRHRLARRDHRPAEGGGGPRVRAALERRLLGGPQRLPAGGQGRLRAEPRRRRDGEPGAGGRGEAALADPELGAATIQMRNELPHGHFTQTGLLRLFRRDPSVRFRGRIHEEVGTDVAASSSGRGASSATCEGPSCTSATARSGPAPATRRSATWPSCAGASPRSEGLLQPLQAARAGPLLGRGGGRPQPGPGLPGRARQDGLSRSTARQRWAGGLLAMCASAAHADDPAAALALLADGNHICTLGRLLLAPGGAGRARRVSRSERPTASPAAWTWPMTRPTSSWPPSVR